MKLSAKLFYAIKAMGQLSLSWQTKEPMKIKDISDRQNIPERFLVQILISLKNKGLVESIRGVSGGYILKKNPSSMSLYDIVKAIDENLITLENSDRFKSKDRLDNIVYSVWEDLNKDIQEKLKQIKFDNIVDSIRKKSPIYYI